MPKIFSAEKVHQNLDPPKFTIVLGAFILGADSPGAIFWRAIVSAAIVRIPPLIWGWPLTFSLLRFTGKVWKYTRNFTCRLYEAISEQGEYTEQRTLQLLLLSFMHIMDIVWQNSIRFGLINPANSRTYLLNCSMLLYCRYCCFCGCCFRYRLCFLLLLLRHTLAISLIFRPLAKHIPLKSYFWVISRITDQKIQ